MSVFLNPEPGSPLTGQEVDPTLAGPGTARAEVDVTDWGADPTGAADCTGAVAAALDHARSLDRPTAVVFPTGNYLFTKAAAQRRTLHISNTDTERFPVKHISVLLDGLHDVTLDGRGSTWLLDGDLMALAVVNCRDITVTDLTWRSVVPSTSEMTVVRRGADEHGDWTDFFVPADMPYDIDGTHLIWRSGIDPATGAPYWTEQDHHDAELLVGFDPTTRTSRRLPLTSSPFHGVRRIEARSDGLLRVHYVSARPEVHREGMVLLLTATNRRHTAGAFLENSHRVQLSSVTMHDNTGFGFVAQLCADLDFERVRVVPPNGSGRVCGSCADGVHISGASDRVSFRDCDFAMTMDDPINVHGTYLRVEEQLDSHTVRLAYVHRQQYGFDQYHVGDLVRLIRRSTLLPLTSAATYRVVEVQQPARSGPEGRFTTIRLDRDLPPGLATPVGGESDVVVENLTYSPELTVRGCRFSSIVTRGVLASTPVSVTIQENVFRQVTMPCVFISGDADEWYESGPVSEADIRGNVFVLSRHGIPGTGTAPALLVEPVVRGRRYPEHDSIHRGITFADNLVHLHRDRLVEAFSVHGLQVTGNEVWCTPDAEEEPVRTSCCRDVVVAWNEDIESPTPYPPLKVQLAGEELHPPLCRAVILPASAQQATLQLEGPTGNVLEVCRAFDREAFAQGEGSLDVELPLHPGMNLWTVRSPGWSGLDVGLAVLCAGDGQE